MSVEGQYEIPSAMLQAQAQVQRAGLRLYRDDFSTRHSEPSITERAPGQPIAESDVDFIQLGEVIALASMASAQIAVALQDPMISPDSKNELKEKDGALDEAKRSGNIKAVQAIAASASAIAAKATAESGQLNERLGGPEKALHALLQKMEKLSDELEKLYGQMLKEDLITQDTYDDLMEKKRLAGLYPVGSEQWKKAQADLSKAYANANKEAEGNAKTDADRQLLTAVKDKTQDRAKTLEECLAESGKVMQSYQNPTNQTTDGTTQAVEKSVQSAGWTSSNSTQYIQESSGFVNPQDSALAEALNKSSSNSVADALRESSEHTPSAVPKTKSRKEEQRHAIS